LTFKDVATLTEESWKTKLRKGELRKVTYDGYTGWMNQLVRNFGKRMFWEIQKDEIEKHIEKIIKDHSVVTANRILFVLKQIFKTGLKEKAITENPVETISYFSEKHHSRNRFLLPNQLAELVKACQHLRGSQYMSALIYLGAEHGACRQEALSLKWTDINFEYQEQGIIGLFRTKNSIRRQFR
jgi:integrase